MNWKKDSLGYYEFVLPVASAVSQLEDSIMRHYLEVSEEDLEKCRMIILSGTALKDNLTLSQPEKFSWLRAVQKPVLGICAGMQTIARVFGVKLVKSVEIGMTRVTSCKDNNLFSGSFEAYSLHNYSVSKSSRFEVLAESESCIQAMKQFQKPIYGVLFHPEVRNPAILTRFIQLE
jgi:GMP synthase (glutamine-hydrolysing)